jgi:hypothetical protein
LNTKALSFLEGYFGLLPEANKKLIFAKITIKTFQIQIKNARKQEKCWIY